ncbi:MAG: DUF2306 domain-containing protein [Pseudomonadota bacterium]
MARRTLWAVIGLAVLAIAVQGFVWHSAQRGVLGFGGDAEALGRLSGTATSNAAIFAHMILGALVTLLSVVQLAGPVRRRWPRVHRVSGRVLAVAALLTALGGLAYIALRGTVGGPIMSVAFGLYGVLMAVAAVQAPRFAIAGDYARHRRWGLRLIVLGLGSWIYRVHYGLWYGIGCSLGPDTCGLAANDAFTGAFDIVTMFAFYLPYLALLELLFRLRRGSVRNISHS